MKSTHKVKRYDYSKVDSSECYEFWGIHPTKRRLHIDTKRFKNECVQYGEEDLLHDGLFANRSTPYFIPKRKHRNDYVINIILDPLKSLKEDWINEYKPIIKTIKTPNEAIEETRLEKMQFTGCSDDMDEINEESLMEGIHRSAKYEEVIASLYCQFIMKICADVDRYVLTAMTKLGYEKEKFYFGNFETFSRKLRTKDSKAKFKSLSNYKDFLLMHLINNFLKHNSVSTYEELRHSFHSFVRYDENQKTKYKNGVYSASWLVIPRDYIDTLLSDLEIFFDDYAKQFLSEDPDEAEWNYDDYFKMAYRRLVSDLS